MKTRLTIRPSSSAAGDLVCDLDMPLRWEELTQEELRLLMTLQTMNLKPTIMLLLMLEAMCGMRPCDTRRRNAGNGGNRRKSAGNGGSRRKSAGNGGGRRESAGNGGGEPRGETSGHADPDGGRLYSFQCGKYRLELSSRALGYAVETMRWMLEPAKSPVRLDEWGGCEAMSAELYEASFDEYLRLENLYQGYLQTQNEETLDAMLRILYKVPDDKALPDGRERQVGRCCVLVWMAGWKAMAGAQWPDLFCPAANATGTGAEVDMMRVMNAELRALTGGDVTKEREVRGVDCWRALEELNAKAREAREYRK